MIRNTGRGTVFGAPVAVLLTILVVLGLVVAPVGVVVIGSLWPRPMGAATGRDASLAAGEAAVVAGHRVLPRRPPDERS